MWVLERLVPTRNIRSSLGLQISMEQQYMQSGPDAYSGYFPFANACIWMESIETGYAVSSKSADSWSALQSVKGYQWMNSTILCVALILLHLASAHKAQIVVSKQDISLVVDDIALNRVMLWKVRNITILNWNADEP